jgi:hypothetical protein
VKAKKTEYSETVLRLPGGTEKNDLWFYPMEVQDEVLGRTIAICSVWVPTHEERERIANGENVRLICWSEGHPPVAMDVTDERVIGANVGS